MKISRRSFLESSAAAAAVTASGGFASMVIAKETALAAGPGNKWPGRIVVNFNKGAVTGTAGNPSYDQTVVKKMVDDSILLLTGAATVGDAWKAVFPTNASGATLVTLQSKIAIKVPMGFNTSLAAPNPYVVLAIVQGLEQMVFNGTNFPAANISIYDMMGSGTFSALGITAALFPGVTITKESGVQSYSDGAAYTPVGSTTKTVKGYTATLHASDFLINVPSLRGHGDYAGNVTLGFKSHYGTYNPDYHDDTDTPPFLSCINCTGPVYNKTVLTVLCAIFGLNESNGPGGSPQDYSTYAKTVDPTSTTIGANTVLMSTDPISVDMQAIKIMRLNKKPAGAYTVADMPPYLRASAGVTGALATIYNIGIIDETAMDIRRIINGVSSSSVIGRVSLQGGNSTYGVVASPIRGANYTFIEFGVPRDRAGNEAVIRIFDARGTTVRSMTQKVLGVANHLVWDQTNSSRAPVARGTYVVDVACGIQHMSTHFSIVK